MLVLAPRSKLAVQIMEDAQKFGRALCIRALCCYGSEVDEGEEMEDSSDDGDGEDNDEGIFSKAASETMEVEYPVISRTLQ